MDLHWIIILIFVTIIVIIQISVYRQTKKKLDLLGDIFPSNPAVEFYVMRSGSFLNIVSKDNYEALKQNKEIINNIQEEIGKIAKVISEIERDETLTEENRSQALTQYKTKLNDLHKQLKNTKKKPKQKNIFSNPIRNNIINSINIYLEKNSASTSDYQLLKDIIDRNVDSEEEEIRTQLPIPLYCGLMGTMLGIIIGIGWLWLSGGLDSLLSDSGSVEQGANGIQALLSSVALAMIASVVGIILTTSGSWKTKGVKAEEELKKHSFLSWIQAELLPMMNADYADTMRQMVQNLQLFNSSFHDNAEQLNVSLQQINNAAQGQAQILHEINDLKIDHLVAANIDVYDKLKHCTHEIGQLGIYLNQVDGFLEQITRLNQQLSDADSRVRCIEEMGRYFRDERADLGVIKAKISKAMVDTDEIYQSSITALRDNIVEQNNNMSHFMIGQQERLRHLLEEQQNALLAKSQEVSNLVEELKQLTDVKASIRDMSSAISRQSHRLEQLSESIDLLARNKAQTSLWDTFLQLPKSIRITIASVTGVLVLWFNVWMVLSLTL